MRCTEMIETVQNSTTLQNHHCRKHNQLQLSMLARLSKIFIHKDKFILPRCHNFVVSSLDSWMSLEHFKTKPKANSFFFFFFLLSHSVVYDSLQPHGLIQALGIFQARILQWVAFPLSRGSSQPRNQIQLSCIAGRFFTN